MISIAKATSMANIAIQRIILDRLTGGNLLANVGDEEWEYTENTKDKNAIDICIARTQDGATITAYAVKDNGITNREVFETLQTPEELLEVLK